MSGAPAGYFGKVTSHGDFVSRRLPAGLSEVWDGWLQQCMHASRKDLGAAWLGYYLTSPLWRFAAAPGVLAQQGWAGVMMPSVDRVGRHFPLMLGAPLPAEMGLLACVQGARAWYDALDDLARESLGAAFVLERFDHALAQLPGAPGQGPCPSGAGPWRLPMGERDQVPEGIAELLLQGHSVWWTEGAPAVAPSLLVCRGLPPPGAFGALLDGRWQAFGWQMAQATV